jgi:hypothetical protein
MKPRTGLSKLHANRNQTNTYMKVTHNYHKLWRVHRIHYWNLFVYHETRRKILNLSVNVGTHFGKLSSFFIVCKVLHGFVDEYRARKLCRAARCRLNPTKWACIQRSTKNVPKTCWNCFNIPILASIHLALSQQVADLLSSRKSSLCSCLISNHCSVSAYKIDRALKLNFIIQCLSLNR